MDIEYDIKKQAGGLLEVDEVGQLCIEAKTEDGKECYLIIRTTMGTSYILEYGPIVPDLGTMNNIKETPLSCTMYPMQFNQKKLLNTIYNFLNKSTYKIVSATIIDYADALNRCEDLIKLYKNSLGM